MLTAHIPDLAAALERHVKVLARDIGERNVFRPDALQAAADYIAQQWTRRGCVVTRQDYQVRGVPCANIEVALAGCVQADEFIVLGAHYDTVRNSPGADDNASGVAALLEIVGMLQALSPRYTVRCVAFVNEEAPFFFRGDMGSLRYARAARLRGDRIRLMLSLEMLGYYQDEPGTQRYPPLLRYFYPARGNFIAFVSNLRSARRLRWIVDAFQASSSFPLEAAALPWWVPGVALSDHSSFWRLGYPAVMVTDTAYLRNPHYHTAHDVPATLDYGRMAAVTRGLAASVASLGPRGASLARRRPQEKG
ncbi:MULTISPECIES: M28 family peptidase [unclassified Cupriavidus]|uniref:M28 family peptidase n=1 Tax=Cupriavidus TaxID=106589 RepID=UPI002270182B|nr:MULTISPECIES: M28 family peptidase [unclassified Cupriavidus]MCY0854854.1 M28 family peptidase [Cupriavidus sp. D39]MDW3682905.1 M28 family peptidase [Cupriavidus sp. CV2]